MNNNGVKCEVCIDSIASAIEAEQGGAHRVELCADLFEGGLTPSAGMIKSVKRSIKIPLHVLIRPRAGDFCYSDAEFNVMKEDIEICKQYGVDGVVIGCLTCGGDVDVQRLSELVVTAGNSMSVTFHRAFDMARAPLKALEDIISVSSQCTSSSVGGIQRILTSGQENSCLEGLDLLAELVQAAANRIIIMPGGGITERNVHKIIRGCNAKEFHVSGRITKESPMKYKNVNCFMGGVLRPSEFSISVASSNKISNFVQIASESRETAQEFE